MKIQITIDELTGNALQSKARELGFSTSSYVRYLLRKLMNNHLNEIDKSIQDIENGRVETVSFEKFQQELRDMY